MPLSPLVAGTWRLHERGWSARETLAWIERWAKRWQAGPGHGLP